MEAFKEQVQDVMNRVDGLFPAGTSFMRPFERWDAIIDEFESALFQVGLAGISEAGHYFRTFMKDTVYYLRAARNQAIEAMGQPLPVEEKGNNQDRRGMTDFKLGTEDKREVKKVARHTKARKVIKLANKKLAKRDHEKSMKNQLDKLAEYALSAKNAVEEGKHKEVAVEMLFENLEEVVSSSSSAFTEKLEKMKKMKMSTYTQIATFKPKTDLRRRRPCEEEEAEKSKKKAKRTSADDLALS
jgi:hypothetical protein